MIEVRIIDKAHESDINLKNEPFQLSGKIIPTFDGEKWGYSHVQYAQENITEMCFPDENYDYDAMVEDGSVFVGAYDGDKCIGLALLQDGFFDYMYLSDLKVSSAYRGQHVGAKLMEKSKEIALEHGFHGIYGECHENNPNACLFYLNSGFYIGGFDNNVYKGTKQEGKADIIFYLDC